MRLHNFSFTTHSFRLCFATAVIMSMLVLSGCNLLGISPQRRQPAADNQATPETGGKLKSYEAEQRLLAARLDALEEQMEQERHESQERLQDMDRTISLLEQSIINLKQAQTSKQPQKKKTSQQQDPTKTAKPAKPIKQVEAARAAEASRPNEKAGAGSDILTPLSSRAVETVSLLKSGSKKEQLSSSKKKKPVRKLPVVGIVAANKKKSTPKYQAWEDPDMEDPPSPIELRVVSGAKRRYQQAFKIYSSRNYTESIKRFNTFLLDFPDDQDADNSQFWIGQAEFQLGNYLNAERAFRKVLRNYSHGSTRRGYKTPDAALMLGRIYLIRKRPIKARYYFEQVIQKYPDSRSAVKATREIEAIDSF